MATTTFNKRVDAWVKHTQSGMATVHALAVEGMEHFAGDGEGDLSYLGYLSNAILSTEGYVRHTALVVWLAKYGPFICDRKTGAVTKNKSADATELNLDGAKQEPFWKTGKEITVATPYDGDNILADLKRVIARYEGEQKVAKDGVDETMLLRQANSMLDKLASVYHASNIDPNATVATTKAASVAV